MDRAPGLCEDPGVLDRETRRRRIATPLLLGWMAVVALAGWTPEVRPAFLDGAQARAVDVLRLFGMSAGQPLFHTDANPWKQHAFCLYLRARPAPASGALLFPADGGCHFLGFHWRLPPVDRALHRMLSTAFGLRGRGEVAQSDAFPRAIGRSYCLSAHGPGGTPLVGLDGAWIWYFKNYDTGQVLRRDGLVFSYTCADATLAEREWQPNDAAVLAVWGTPPWH